MNTAQNAQLYDFTQHSGNTAISCPFDNNLEHLKALEHEAILMLACCYLKRRNGGLCSHDGEDNPKFQFIDQQCGVTEAQALLIKTSAENRQREAVSTSSEKTLNFEVFCEQWRLDWFERNVSLLLLMQNIAPDFIAIFSDCRFEKSRGAGIEIGTILSILCPDLSSQLEHRHYFSIISKLFNNDLIAIQGDIDDTTNILNEKVFLPERLVRFILGDNNLYNSCFKFIRRERIPIRLEQVILPEDLKDDVTDAVGNYLARRHSDQLNMLDRFYGYGTSLTIMFYGPSGTGKTMLAHAIATRFDRTVFSLSAEDMREMPGSYEIILSTLFKEAALQGAIVFLDECDDLFAANGKASRALLLELEKARCVVIMATNKPINLDPAIERRISLKIHFEVPNESIRKSIWCALIPDSVKLSSDVDIALLARKYQFSGGLIRNAILLAIALHNTATHETPVLTMAELEKAAERQIASFADERSLCTTYRPCLSLDNLPLRAIQKSELKNLAIAWERLRERKSGLAIIISSNDIPTALKTAEALAAECEIEVRSYDYSAVQSLSEADKIIDFSTQRLILPIEYAFSATAATEAMTLFIDHEGVFGALLGEQAQDSNQVEIQSVVSRLRHYTGFFCMVTSTTTTSAIPNEFSLHLHLDPPGEEVQLRCWEKLLGDVTPKEQHELLKLVEDYPLHLAEIECIARQAEVLSTVKRLDSKPSFDDLRTVISNHRKENRQPLLFGATNIWAGKNSPC